MRLQVVADQTGSKHTGDSRNRGKVGQALWPITTPGRRGRGDAHLWRRAGARQRMKPAFVLARVLNGLPLRIAAGEGPSHSSSRGRAAVPLIVIRQGAARREGGL